MSDPTKVESTIRDVVIEEVTTRTVGQNASTLWEIKTAGGPTVTTFKAQLGNAARNIWEQGQIADMVITVSQNGKYTNYYLEKIQVSAKSVTTEVGRAAVRAQETQEVSFEKFAKVEQDKREADREREESRNESIHRQTATKVAAALSGPEDSAQDFWANVQDLVAFYKTGMVPAAYALNQAIATTVTSHSDDGQSADDDIPF